MPANHFTDLTQGARRLAENTSPAWGGSLKLERKPLVHDVLLTSLSLHVTWWLMHIKDASQASVRALPPSGTAVCSYACSISHTS